MAQFSLTAAHGGRVNQSDSSASSLQSEPVPGWKGGAQIRATVPTKLRRGQVVKRHVLWVTHHPAAAMQLRHRSGTWIGKEGENRESKISVAQPGKRSNERNPPGPRQKKPSVMWHSTKCHIAIPSSMVTCVPSAHIRLEALMLVPSFCSPLFARKNRDWARVEKLKQ